MGNIVKSINQKLKQSPNESINVIFGETQTILSLRKPKKKPPLKPVNYVNYISNHAPVSRHQITLVGVT